MERLPTLRQLAYLTTLAQERHFGRAAQACHVTQSTLSAGIKELEELLAAPLVDRTRRSVVLTPLGEEVVARGRRILDDAADLARVARASAEPLAGPVRLGVIPTIGPFLLPRALPPLRRSFPRLQLYLTEDLTARLVEQLEAGRLDVLLLALPCDCGGAETLVLAEDLFSVAMRRDHPLARATHVAEDRLAGEPVLLLEDGHCLRDHALAACSLTESRDSRAFAATSLYTLVQMVANGLGVTLLPRLAIDAGILKGTDVVARPLLAARPSRQIGLAWRRGTRRRDEFALLGRWLMPKGAGERRITVQDPVRLDLTHPARA